MKKYIKPEINVVPIVLENAILAGSTSVGIGEGPATGPALSKGNNFFDGEEDDEEEYFGAPKRSSTSLWND
ncbi:toxin PIN [Segatella buccae]|uniref:toxin PIN n=1 Tax=Segatella buccae TaxID=28126 RepID=UPI00248DE176|nr:toxin PIN [Segatella buccae]